MFFGYIFTYLYKYVQKLKAKIMSTLLKDLKGLKNNEIMTYYTKVGLSKQKGASVCKKENVFLVVNREAILRCGGAQYAVVFGSKNKDYKICNTTDEAVNELKKLKVKS